MHECMKHYNLQNEAHVKHCTPQTEAYAYDTMLTACKANVLLALAACDTMLSACKADVLMACAACDCRAVGSHR